MKLGIIRNACDDAAFQFVREKKLDFIEVCLNFPKDADAFNKRGAEIAKLIKKYNIPVLSVGRWNGDGGPLDAKGKIKAANLKEAKKTIDVCAKIGCPVYNCGVNRVEGLSFFRNCEAAIKYLKELIDYGRDRGVKIATYNCHWNAFTGEPKAWELIHDELPELGIKFDASHTVSAGRDYMKEIDDWGHRFYHVHIKGVLRVNGKYVDDPPAGLDQINWRALMGMLYARKYNGTLSIEPHSATWQGELGERGIDLTIAYIRSLMV